MDIIDIISNKFNLSKYLLKKIRKYSKRIYRLCGSSLFQLVAIGREDCLLMASDLKSSYNILA